LLFQFNPVSDNVVHTRHDADVACCGCTPSAGKIILIQCFCGITKWCTKLRI